MFPNDPILWQYAVKDREQARLQDAEDYRRAKRVQAHQPAPSRQKLVIALVAAAPIVLWVVWVFFAG